MQKKTVRLLALAFLAQVISLGAMRQARAQSETTPYPTIVFPQSVFNAGRGF
jgi:hypothetical protein